MTSFLINEIYFFTFYRIITIGLTTITFPVRPSETNRFKNPINIISPYNIICMLKYLKYVKHKYIIHHYLKG